MSDVAPPATGEWWDESATVAAVLHTLRLQGGDVDTIRLQNIIPAAAQSMEIEADRIEPFPGPPPDPLVQYELERRTIVMYQADIPVAAIVPGAPAWLPDGGSRDVVRGYRQRWGAA